MFVESTSDTGPWIGKVKFCSFGWDLYRIRLPLLALRLTYMRSETAKEVIVCEWSYSGLVPLGGSEKTYPTSR